MESTYFDYADNHDDFYEIDTKNSTLAVSIAAPIKEIERNPNQFMRVVFR